LWIIGVGFVILVSSGEIWTLIIGMSVVWIILELLKKAFFYVVLGNNK
jgi:uncharacterized cupin superfamily protein